MMAEQMATERTMTSDELARALLWCESTGYLTTWLYKVRQRLSQMNADQAAAVGEVLRLVGGSMESMR